MPEENRIFLYSTEKREKVDVSLLFDEKIKMYTCGPTVYNFAHIGNLRTYVFEDLLRRTLKYFGYHVFQVMNLTDVDDKTIKGALEQNISLEAYTKPYIQAFFKDLETLHIEKAEKYPAATNYIAEMIDMIKVLLDKGYAYQGKDNCIYFKIASFPEYGKLSHLCLEDLKAGASERIDTDEYEKDTVSDFVLWKSFDKERDGNVYWDSPFGKGRPGWHIECSAMATAILGETIDIHVGGVDNIFPHHENEIAQSECCSGKSFVKHWMHSEHLVVNGRKMSKSLGNFFTLRDLLKLGYTGSQIRYLLISTHYRTQLNFSLQGLESAKQTLRRLQDLIQRLQEIEEEKNFDISSLLEKSTKDFKDALADDLNISVAIAALFDLLRELNTLCDKHKLGKSAAKMALEFFHKCNQVLAFIPFKPEKEEIPEEIEEYLQKRESARKAKDFQKADQFRDMIYDRGYIIEDTKAGPRVKSKD